MKKFNTLLLTAAFCGGCLALGAAEVELAGVAIKKLEFSRPGEVLKLDDAVGLKTAAQNKSALYQQKLNWQAGNIKQIIVTARFDQPGQLRWACNNTLADGKKVSLNFYNTIIPDNEYHDYIFDMSSNANWQGVMTNYELRFFGPEGTTFALKKIVSSTESTIKLMGVSLKGKVATFKARELENKDGITIQIPGKFGGFHQQKLNWKTDEINTVPIIRNKYPFKITPP